MENNANRLNAANEGSSPEKAPNNASGSILESVASSLQSLVFSEKNNQSNATEGTQDEDMSGNAGGSEEEEEAEEAEEAQEEAEEEAEEASGDNILEGFETAEEAADEMAEEDAEEEAIEEEPGNVLAENVEMVNQEVEAESGESEELLTFNNDETAGQNINIDELKETIEVTEDVYVQEEERIHHNDDIYLKDLEAQILSTYPVSKQGLRFVQQEVSQEASDIIDAKNMGLKKYIQLENGFEYPVIEDLYNNIYSNSWIIPVVMDKHKIYSIMGGEIGEAAAQGGEGAPKKRATLSENENEESYITETLESEEGIKAVNQINQHKVLWKVRHDAALGAIGFVDYMKMFYKIESPYISQPRTEENMTGFFTKLQNNALVLRYHDLDTNQWSVRNAMPNTLSYKDTFDEETGRISGVQPYTLVDGEVVQIVGFMVLAKENDTDGRPPFSRDLDDVNSKNPLVKKLVMTSKIISITQVGDYIKIKAPNHGLTKTSSIYIDKSNCVPNIDGMKRHIALTIEDKDSFSIKSSKRISKDGSFGEIYSVNPLVYDRYRVAYNEQVDEYIPQFEGSTYRAEGGGDGEGTGTGAGAGAGDRPLSHNRLYLFNDLVLKNRDDFRRLLTKVVPTLEQIVEMNADALGECYTFFDVERVLSKYHLKMDDLKVDQVDFIKRILKSNLEKVKLQEEITKREALPIFHLRNKDRFGDKNFFLADLYITNPDVTKYYGEYDHIGKPEDCVSARLVWLMEQRDHGIIFFSEMMKMNYGLFKELHDKKFVDSMIQQYSGFVKNTEKQFNREDALEKSLRNKAAAKGGNKGSNGGKPSCELYRFQLNPSEDLAKNLNKLVTDEMPNGTMALVGKDIYVWNAEAESWDLSEIVPKYSSIQYLCTFNNTDLSELNLEDLENVYKRDFGCHSKLYIRFKERLQYVSEIHSQFVNLKEYLEKDDYIQFFQNQIDLMVKLHYVTPDTTKNSDEEKEKREEEEAEEAKEAEEEAAAEEEKRLISSPADLLIRQIYGIKNEEIRETYLYHWLDKDGLLVGDRIYSKKFLHEINPMYLCGHHIYKNREYKATDMATKFAIYQQMLDKFGDGGAASEESQTCRVCARVIGTYKVDDVEGYTEAGQMIKSREVWTKDEEEGLPQTVREIEEYDPTTRVVKCDTPEFRKIFLDKGFSSVDVDFAKKICMILQNNLCAKIGINLHEQDTIAIIVDSMTKIRSLMNYTTFISIKGKEMMRLKGFREDRIVQMAKEGKFEGPYKIYTELNTNAIISARFLISVQTAIPEYIHNAKNSPCEFFSFDGINGIQYLACILMKIGTLGKSVPFDELMSNYMKTIGDHYTSFSKMTAVHQLIQKKREYKVDLARRVKEFNTSLIGDVEIVYDAVDPLPSNFVETVRKAKSFDEIEGFRRQWIKRIGYLNQALKAKYVAVVNEAELMDVNPESGPGISLVEKACCQEYVDEYEGYITYVQEKAGEDSHVVDMVDEIKSLYKLRYLFNNNGLYHRVTVTGDSPNGSYFITNEAAYASPQETSDEMILEKFATYVDEGPYTGTMRLYAGMGKDRKDIKSGKLYDEIMSKKYTKAEYEQLLNRIAERNKMNLDFYIYQIPDLEEMLKKKINIEMEKERLIEGLISSLKTILGKSGDKEFSEKYTKILYNIGFYQSYLAMKKKVDGMTDAPGTKPITKKMTTKNAEMLAHIRVKYLKKCYNDYLRKYLSMIKNGKSRITEIQTLKDEDLLGFDPIASREIQSFIFDQYNAIEKFYDSTVRTYFEGVALQNSAAVISRMSAEDNIYDCQYKEVMEYARFSYADCANVLHCMFVRELNDLILCNKGGKEVGRTGPEDEEIDAGAGSEDEDLVMNAAAMTPMCKYRCMFILFILDKIQQDTEMMDLCTEEVEKIANYKNFMYMSEVERAINSDDDQGYFLKQLQYMMEGRSTATVGLPEEGAGEEMTDDQIAKQETMELFVEKTRAEYKEQHGTDIPADMLETMKEDYMENKYNEALMEAENDKLEEGQEGDYGNLTGNDVDADFDRDELAFMAAEE